MNGTRTRREAVSPRLPGRRAALLWLALAAVVAGGVGCSGDTEAQVEPGPDDQVMSDPAWSPTGSLIAFSGGPFGENAGIWVVQPDGQGLARLTRARSTHPTRSGRPTGG